MLEILAACGFKATEICRLTKNESTKARRCTSAISRDAPVRMYGRIALRSTARNTIQKRVAFIACGLLAIWSSLAKGTLRHITKLTRRDGRCTDVFVARSMFGQ